MNKLVSAACRFAAILLCLAFIDADIHGKIVNGTLAILWTSAVAAAMWTAGELEK